MAKNDYARYRPEKKTVVEMKVSMDPLIAEAFMALAKMKGEDAIDMGMFLEDVLKKAGVVKMAEELAGFSKNGVEK